jgi:hypothetical protein
MRSLSLRPGHNQSQPGGCGCDLWTPIAVFGKCVRLVTANGADVGGWSYPSTIGSRYLQHCLFPSLSFRNAACVTNLCGPQSCTRLTARRRLCITLAVWRGGPARAERSLIILAWTLSSFATRRSPHSMYSSIQCRHDATKCSRWIRSGNQ